MDGVSTVANVGQIAGGLFKLIEILHKIQQGGKQRLRLLTSISSLWTVLTSVQSALTTEDDDIVKDCPETLKSLFNDNGEFSQATRVWKQLEERLEPKGGLRGVIQDLKWPMTKLDVESWVSQLDRLASTINSALTSSTYLALREVQKDTKALKAATFDQNLEALLSWLCHSDFFKQQQKLSSQVHEKTGQWFLETSEFKSWINGTDKTLWCDGIPGAGKTYLTSIVVEHLRKVQPNMVLVIYCGYMDPQDQKKGNVLAALIRQMIQLHPALADALKERYKAYSSQGRRFSTEELHEIFRAQLAQVGNTCIIVDALDDVAEEYMRYEILDTVICKDTNVMVTSRPLEIIKALFDFDCSCDKCQDATPSLYRCRNCMDQSNTLCEACYGDLPACENGGHSRNRIFGAYRREIVAPDADIHKFVQWRINRSETLSNIVRTRSHLREKIATTVVERAGGMFLLAKLHMDALTPKRTPRAVWKALEILPDSIDDTYDQAIRRIRPSKEDTNEEDSKYAMHLLMWMTYARRPLTTAEMEHAVTTSYSIWNATEDASLVSEIDDIDVDEILSASELTSMCAGLVIIDASNKVLFVHFTAQKYFLSHAEKLFPDAQLAIAHSCLNYLSLQPLPHDIEYLERRLETYALLKYTCNHLGRHVAQTEADVLTEMVVEWLKDQAHVDMVAQILRLCGTVGGEMPLIFHQGLLPQHLAAYWGLEDIIFRLLRDQDYSANSPYPGHRSPLSHAAWNGDASTVGLLLEAGADPNLTSMDGSTALHFAVQRDEQAVAGLLLGHPGLNLATKDRTGFTPWMLAVLLSRHAMVEIFLQQPGYDNMAERCRGWTAQDYAKFNRDDEMIEILRQHSTTSTKRNLRVEAASADEAPIQPRVDDSSDRKK
ncbi:uncharacterized protein KY384_006281 [Bacidia gigantensis]|uniref:uncharacterized protein n=1 Tax=Bacidia gigantensis TaxID=2732470 RepID=UPI001D03C9DF|nr:uncharacterized protein KY384_006281 [Bacidia gigantensis]KAG8528594.1 hypothetical protein KY384_006281 [Bacidia gigantensis]